MDTPHPTDGGARARQLPPVPRSLVRVLLHATNGGKPGDALAFDRVLHTQEPRAAATSCGLATGPATPQGHGHGQFCWPKGSPRRSSAFHRVGGEPRPDPPPNPRTLLLQTVVHLCPEVPDRGGSSSPEHGALGAERQEPGPAPGQSAGPQQGRRHQPQAQLRAPSPPPPSVLELKKRGRKKTPNAVRGEDGQGLRQVTPATSPFLRNGENREQPATAGQAGGAPTPRDRLNRTHVRGAGKHAAPSARPSRGLAETPKPNPALSGGDKTQQRRTLERPWNTTAGPCRKWSSRAGTHSGHQWEPQGGGADQSRGPAGPPRPPLAQS